MNENKLFDYLYTWMNDDIFIFDKDEIINCEF